MSEYTEKLLRNLSMIGSASRRLMNTAPKEKKAPAQQLVLDILFEEDGLTQGVLAEILDIRPSSLTEVLNKLENRGEIRRCEDPKDKRIKQVFITDVGRSKANPVKERQDRSEEFFVGLSDEELIQLDQLLNKIVSGWLEDFCDFSDMPRTPLDALDSLKEIKRQFGREFMDRDLRDASPEERRRMKREMKQRMRQQFGRRGFRHPEFGGGPFENGRGVAKEWGDQEPQQEKDEWDNW